MFLGYFLKKICCSTKSTSLYSKQYLSFLIAGKCAGENVTLPELKHVNFIDIDDLRKVDENLVSIFKITECCFSIATQKHIFKTDCNGVVLNVMAEATALHHHTVLKSKSEADFKKKTALNLLED